MRIQNIEMVVALKVCEIIRVDTKKFLFHCFGHCAKTTTSSSMHICVTHMHIVCTVGQEVVY